VLLCPGTDKEGVWKETVDYGLEVGSLGDSGPWCCANLIGQANSDGAAQRQQEEEEGGQEEDDEEEGPSSAPPPIIIIIILFLSLK
jgi:hypothetical protein